MTVDMRCAQNKRRYERLISSHVYGVCVCHELAFAVFTEEIKILLISTHLLIIVLSLEFKPVFGFGAFFQGDLKLCYKIRLAMSVKSFMNVRANARSGTKKLVNERPLTPCLAQHPAGTYDLKCESIGLKH